jgi:predicted nucleotidyltransferase
MSVREKWSKQKPLKVSHDELKDIVLSILRENPQILISYLFGSTVKGTFKEYSDIDIAIYTSKDFSWSDFYQLYGDLTKKIHSDRVDLVWLNKAEPILCFEIIKTGRVFFYRDEDVLNDFEFKTKKRYYDYIIYLRKHRSYRESDL